MSYSISTLLTRNLHDVFGENDPARRRAAIDEIFTEDCVFYEPRGVYRGRDEIDRVAGAIKATHPDFQYQPIAEPEDECQKFLVKYFEAVKSKDVGKIQKFASYVSHADSAVMPAGSVEMMRETKRNLLQTFLNG